MSDFTCLSEIRCFYPNITLLSISNKQYPTEKVWINAIERVLIFSSLDKQRICVNTQLKSSKKQLN